MDALLVLNSGENLSEVINALISGGEVIAAAALSGNRNFEEVFHLLNQVSFFASSPLCAACALAGLNNDLKD